MKKLFRIMIPIVMVLAIILCLCWYLFVYDTTFTRDVLLFTARKFESEGNHQAASWFYDAAYHQASDNDAVAIELAQQHKLSGNYTQAEYTLSNAIADGGGVDLYIALCKTYVEQDKLLDAVSMLDNIGNADIKNQISALRPAAPSTAVEPGFYNQYISVPITAEEGTLYINPNGQYPSIESEPYAEPVQLVDGENTIYAISVAENGLVSPLSIFGYTVGGVVKELNFADPTIESAVRTLLNVPEDKQLYTNDLWSITTFTVPSEAKSYEDLQYFAFLEELIIYTGAQNNLTSISGLANLRKLSVKDTHISTEELQVIGLLPALQELTLSGCSLTTTAGLENATMLTYLDLSNNTIRNIDVLSQMPELKYLYLQNNAVNDLSAISANSQLCKLDVSYNALKTLSPICNLTNLYWLNAANNSIREVAQLGQLTNLTHLSLSNNALTDVSTLITCPKMTELNISNNSITDIGFLGDMIQLTQLDFSHNQVSELPVWPRDAALVQIDGSHNLISTLEPLSGMEYLNNVFMDYNTEIESVEELMDCHMLILVNVYGTKVTEAKSLTQQSIIVNFDPIQVTE